MDNYNRYNDNRDEKIKKRLDENVLKDYVRKYLSNRNDINLTENENHFITGMIYSSQFTTPEKEYYIGKFLSEYPKINHHGRFEKDIVSTYVEAVDEYVSKIIENEIREAIKTDEKLKKKYHENFQTIRDILLTIDVDEVKKEKIWKILNSN